MSFFIPLFIFNLERTPVILTTLYPQTYKTSRTLFPRGGGKKINLPNFCLVVHFCLHQRASLLLLARRFLGLVYLTPPMALCFSSLVLRHVIVIQTE